MAPSTRNLPETDREIEEVNRNLMEIISFLNENYPTEAEFALMKLESASRDLHKLRIDKLLNGK